MTGWKVHGLVELGLTMVSLVCAAIPTASMARDKVQVVTYMWYKEPNIGPPQVSWPKPKLQEVLFAYSHRLHFEDVNCNFLDPIQEMTLRNDEPKSDDQAISQRLRYHGCLRLSESDPRHLLMMYISPNLVDSMGSQTTSTDVIHVNGWQSIQVALYMPNAPIDGVLDYLIEALDRLVPQWKSIPPTSTYFHQHLGPYPYTLPHQLNKVYTLSPSLQTFVATLPEGPKILDLLRWRNASTHVQEMNLNLRIPDILNATSLYNVIEWPDRDVVILTAALYSGQCKLMRSDLDIAWNRLMSLFPRRMANLRLYIFELFHNEATALNEGILQYASLWHYPKRWFIHRRDQTSSLYPIVNRKTWDLIHGDIHKYNNAYMRDTSLDRYYRRYHSIKHSQVPRRTMRQPFHIGSLPPYHLDLYDLADLYGYEPSVQSKPMTKRMVPHDTPESRNKTEKARTTHVTITMGPDESPLMSQSDGTGEILYQVKQNQEQDMMIKSQNQGKRRRVDVIVEALLRISVYGDAYYVRPS